jgi:hypothetical protein
MSRSSTLIGVIAALILAAVAPSLAVAAASPAITKSAPTSIHDNTAVLRDDVNPEGSETHYFFQWGLTTAYGGQSPAGSAGHGTKSVAVGFTATGLVPGSVYHYRLVAQNAVGQTIGDDQTFKTTGAAPPAVATGAASGVGRNTATLTGVVNPGNATTSYMFQYGPTVAYGSSTNVGTVPAGSAPVTVALAVSGLEAGTTFHFRLVAFHSNSPQELGLDSSFLTEPFPRPKPSLTIASTPRTARRAPFTLTTLGKIAGPASIPATLDCAGTVTVKVYNGRHRVGTGSSAVLPGCTFSVATKIARIHHRRHRTRSVRLKVVTTFAGNGYLAPRKGRTEMITIRRA